MSRKTNHREREITRQIHRLFWRGNLQDKRALALCYLTRIPAVAAYNTFIPLVSAYAIQAILTRHFDKVGPFALWVVVLSLLYCVLWAIGNITVGKNAIKGSEYVQNQIFTNFLQKDYEFFSNAYFGALGAQAARLRDAYNNYGELVTLSIPKQLTIVLTGIAVIAYNSPVLALVTLVSMACVLSFTLWSSSWRLQFRRKVSDASSDVAADIGDALTHGTTVKSFAMEDFERRRLEKTMSIWSREQYKSWVSALPADSGRMVLAALATAVLLILSAHLYRTGSVSITVVVLIQLYVIKLVASTIDIADIVKRYEEVMGATYQPIKTMGVKNSITDPPKPRKLSATGDYTLQFHNVTYHYPDANKTQTAVADFSLTINPSEKIGLVGYSGSGKTTLTKLFLRFMDVTSGKITINALDIRDMAQSDVRGIISYVPQEPLLFHRSIAENIGYANPAAKHPAIVRAAHLAYVDEFVTELPKGYDTLVGERGVKLSGGQRQRVAIARALLKDSPILVLDEATSSLDSHSEKYIQKALQKLMENRTAVVIAHRLSTIQHLDRIVVMDKGKIAQVGTHHELLQDTSGIYAQLWAHQSGGYIGVEIT